MIKSVTVNATKSLKELICFKAKLKQINEPHQGLFSHGIYLLASQTALEFHVFVAPPLIGTQANRSKFLPAID